jgi:hypothetical protein
VGGVGEKLAQSPLGGGAFVEGGLNASEHGVQRQTEAAGLGVRIGVGDAFLKLAVSDLRGCDLHAVERAQADAHHP